MIELPNVSLIQIDTIDTVRAFFAMGECMEGIEFGSAKVLCPGEVTDYEAYNRFVVVDLCNEFSTDYVLLCQWDGYVVKADAWDPAFLEYDYVGAPWAYTDGRNVGNGGFSLRSKKFCELTAFLFDDDYPYAPEDDKLCRQWRNMLELNGIRFAPEDLAARFSWEKNPKYPYYTGQFGIHGKHTIDAYHQHLLQLQ
jgi:hypothetical protein